MEPVCWSSFQRNKVFKRWRAQSVRASACSREGSTFLLPVPHSTKLDFNPTQRGGVRVSAEDRSVSERVRVNTLWHIQGCIKHVHGSQVHMETFRCTAHIPNEDFVSQNLKLRPNRKESPRIERPPPNQLPFTHAHFLKGLDKPSALTKSNNQPVETLHVGINTETVVPVKVLKVQSRWVSIRLSSCF